MIHSLSVRLQHRKVDPFFRWLTVTTSCITLAIVLAITIVMATGGWKAFAVFGPRFLITNVWNPVTQQFGAASPLFGTLASSVLAMFIAIPLAFGTTFWLTMIAPPRLFSVVSMAIQLLAAIPSIIFGMWGVLVVVPIIAHVVHPLAQWLFGSLPLFSAFVAGPHFGTGLLTTAFVLAIMITPSITAVMCDVFTAIPSVLRESGYGIGATRWEVVRYIMLPYSREGFIGSIVLGIGRAMGETMAVTFVIGDHNHISWSLFAPTNSIASLIALEFPESPTGSLKLASLLALGAILMVISFFTLWCSRWFLTRNSVAQCR